MAKPREQKQMTDEAVRAGTGRTWPEWFAILDKAGAKKWDHKKITGYLREDQEVGPWWTQMVAVGYEHGRGLRQKFQKCDGEFAASGSRTLGVSLTKLYDAWIDEKQRQRWLPDAKFEITTSTRNKSLRAKWNAGKSRLGVNFYSKGAEKCQVAVDHMKLSSSKESAKMKSYWFEALNRLESQLKLKSS
jgi:hypothetical protein